MDTSCSTRLMSASSCSKSSSSRCNFFCASLRPDVFGEENPGVGVCLGGGGGLSEGPDATATVDPTADPPAGGCGVGLATAGGGVGQPPRSTFPAPGRPMYLIVRRCAVEKDGRGLKRGDNDRRRVKCLEESARTQRERACVCERERARARESARETAGICMLSHVQSYFDSDSCCSDKNP